MKSKSQFDRFLNVFTKTRFIKDLMGELDGGEKDVSVSTLHGSSVSLTAAALYAARKDNYVFIAENAKKAEEILNDIEFFISKKNLALLTKAPKNIDLEIENIDKDLVGVIDGIAKFKESERSVAVASPDIFSVALPYAGELEESKLKIKVGEKINFEEFIKNLALNGFDRKEFVSVQGDIAVRGGIVDIFPLGREVPLRIEFWGDEIESIREFNSLSQRSVRELQEADFISKVYDEPKSDFSSTVFDYLPKDAVIIVESLEAIESQYSEFQIPSNFRKVIINGLEKPDIKVKSTPQPAFKGSVSALVKELDYLSKLDMKLALCADGKIHLRRFKDLISSKILSIEEEGEEIDLDVDSMFWMNGSLHEGFVLPEDGLAIFTEHQSFNRLKIQRPLKESSKGITIQELKQLDVGDLVVHTDKGVGKFDGFEKVKMGDNLQDCVRLVYAGGDKLYVNLNYIGKIQKYTSQEGAEPKLSKLGSAEWARKKARTKKKIKEIARDLIKLYAERKSQPGFVFPADTIWQKEFEAGFIYEDTADQAQSTTDVKKDMESPSPMDRLICGDVGYGKTEVAIRAAFKAVQAGKQTALLCPTTILAQQHYMTFWDRLSKYPVNVEVISRFKKPKEQKRIIENVKKGVVDILIGTHRLLSKDLEYKNLGLLIIDEEHRFGVKAKERLRKLRVSVDTLTLTATPIPRTLNFSLMRARDLSVMETPPRNRLPIHTEVSEVDYDLIERGVKREIERGGQVFFVNDKVMDLEKIASDLKMKLPFAKIGIAHGQMKNSELERVMENFIQGKYDVLATTKIIESGMDIPNANTIFINRAQNFGLAELYQLRGRVGRSNTQAHCYLLIPKIRKLSQKAFKRLRALEEFTDLGSGFKLALRDLEIRGAGNLLGPQQSGFINDIGFEMYQRILDEAVAELRVEEFGDVFKDSGIAKRKYLENEDLAIEFNSQALIPHDYIKSDSERFYYYKNLYGAQSVGELDEIIMELKDRFGKPPKELEELIFVVKLRIAALGTGFNKVTIKNGTLEVEFPPEKNVEFYDEAFPIITDFLSEADGAKLEQKKKKLLMSVPISKRDEAVEKLWRIKQNLKAALEL